MKLTIFSIFDSGTNLFAPPFYARSEGEAIRNVMQAAEDPNSQLNRHPQDFTLFRLGEYEDNTAEFTLEKSPVRVYSLGQNIDTKGNTDEISNDTPVQQST